MNNDEVARRAFHEGLAAQDTPLKNPADYILCRVGRIESATGIIDPEQRTTIATGADWVAANKER